MGVFLVCGFLLFVVGLIRWGWRIGLFVFFYFRGDRLVEFFGLSFVDRVLESF